MHRVTSYASLCLQLASILGITGFSGAVPAQDYSTYYTVTHPKEFEIDWKSFYAKGTEAAKGAKVQVVVEPKADHAGAVWALGDAATATFQAVASMIERNTGAPNISASR